MKRELLDQDLNDGDASDNSGNGGSGNGQKRFRNNGDETLRVLIPSRVSNFDSIILLWQNWK